MISHTIIFSLICLATISESAKILGVFAVPVVSHFILSNKYMRELANRGHDVTVISYYKNKIPPTGGSFRDITLSGTKEQAESYYSDELLTVGEALPVINALFMNSVGNELTNKTFRDPKVQRLLKSNETFDVVVVEQFFNDALKYFSHHYKAPLIIFTSVLPHFWVNHLVGNPEPPSSVVDLLLSFPNEMHVLERVQNALYRVFNNINAHWLFFPEQNRILKENFPHAPNLEKILNNVSLILVNSHVSVNPPVPLVPNMVEIGGLHVNPPKQLPADLKDFLDNAEDGAIYFSLGSSLKSVHLPKEKRRIIQKVFSELKQRVLWKWENNSMPDNPQNVKLGKWIPQQDVLAHPNVKLFITHAGLLSTTESIYHGVPMLAIPVFADQKRNAHNAVYGGYGLQIDYQELTEDNLRYAINETLNNSRYSSNAKWRSAIMHDRPLKPLDNAIYWTEYVIRHGGAPQLRVAGLDQVWYQYLLLDVLLIILAVPVSITCILVMIIRKLWERRKVKVTKKKVKRH